MRKKIILIALAVVVIGFGVIVSRLARLPNEEIMAERFITANPLDLKQIQGFSKYRSCVGHDYRSSTLAGEMEKTPRSMKHYVIVKPEFRGTVDKVDAFAPFDGEISVVENDLSSGSQVWLTPNPRRALKWQFVFFHITLDNGLQKGTKVAAGQHIGKAYLKRGSDDTTDNFDMGLKFTQPMRRPAVDVLFGHATQSVVEEYNKYGIDIDDLIISEGDRDLNPCPLSSRYDGPDVTFPHGMMADDYVWLK
ncbi:hypothetical protein HY477_00150 [Candidatus Uhrbacteria bacterium]|nr:hypothetical protein [Candidatus Uhrbacteria bacterium]